MPTEYFYEEQSDATFLKTIIYQNYIQGYLIKILLQYKKCYISDLFCGCGKNGSSDGSPLVLLKILIDLFKEVPLIKDTSVEIFFNDRDDSLIATLKAEVDKLTMPQNIRIYFYSQDFNSLLPVITAQMAPNKPRFFFLDPFTYSTIPMATLQNLFSQQGTEIMLFLPIFHSYRFASWENMPEKLRNFINTYTTRGCYDYTDVYEFAACIKNKLKQELGAGWVREMPLRDGNRINALFVITNHIAGMILANDTFWKISDDGLEVTVENEFEGSLFDSAEMTMIQKAGIAFANKLEEELNTRLQMTNKDLIHFTAEQGFCAKHTKKILDAWKKNKKITVEKLTSDAKTGSLYLSSDNWKDSEPAKILVKLVQ